MAYAMTKQGSLDNCVTYEFVCDTLADMNAIENKYRTIGSVAVVLQGESGMEAYIAGSDKQWNNLGTMGASGSGSGSNSEGTSNLSIYTCAQNEVSNGKPNIASPDENTIYLVSAGNESGNLYEEYIYVNNAWEKFGAASINLSGYAPIANPVFTGSISLGRKANTATGNNSIALGNDTVASGLYSFAEGNSTISAGTGSHAEGQGGNYQSITLDGVEYRMGAYGDYSHSEGIGTAASGYASHAEGLNTAAATGQSHAEGYITLAGGQTAHAEGTATRALGSYAHAEGNATKALGSSAHAEGSGENNTNDTITISGVVYDIGARGSASHTEGITTGTGSSSSGAHAEGISTFAVNTATHSEGNLTVASGAFSHVEGVLTKATNTQTHAEGYNTTASGVSAHSEGQSTTASGTYSHAEGNSTTAAGTSTHAEGDNTQATGVNSHAEGYGGTYTKNNVSYTSEAKGVSDHTEGYQCLTASAQPGNHAEGYQTQATGGAAHAEGSGTIASGASGSHAEGASTTASGSSAHAEGSGTTASADSAHAEGTSTYATGYAAHAEGRQTQATGAYSHVGGVLNIADDYSNWDEWTANTSYVVGDKVKRTTTSNNVTTVKGYLCKTANNDASFTSTKWTDLQGKMNYAEIIGNGLYTDRSNARALDWDGNEYLNGDLYVGCGADSTGGTKLPRIPEAPSTDGTYILQATVTNGTPTYSWVSAG